MHQAAIMRKPASAVWVPLLILGMLGVSLLPSAVTGRPFTAVAHIPAQLGDADHSLPGEPALSELRVLSGSKAKDVLGRGDVSLAAAAVAGLLLRERVIQNYLYPERDHRQAQWLLPVRHQSRNKWWLDERSEFFK